MIVPFRNGTAAVLKYASFRDILDLLQEWAECDFVVFPRDHEQHAYLVKLAEAGLAHGRPVRPTMRNRHRDDVSQASKSRCIAGPSRAGVRAEGDRP